LEIFGQLSLVQRIQPSYSMETFTWFIVISLCANVRPRLRQDKQRLGLKVKLCPQLLPFHLHETVP
jgi:hypothetical protein